MKKSSKSNQSSVPVQHSLTTDTAPAQPAAAAPEAKPDNRLPIDTEARKKNRTLPTQTVVQRLASIPTAAQCATIVGKWVWVQFAEQPDDEVSDSSCGGLPSVRPDSFAECNAAKAGRAHGYVSVLGDMRSIAPFWMGGSVRMSASVVSAVGRQRNVAQRELASFLADAQWSAAAAKLTSQPSDTRRRVPWRWAGRRRSAAAL